MTFCLDKCDKAVEIGFGLVTVAMALSTEAAASVGYVKAFDGAYFALHDSVRFKKVDGGIGYKAGDIVTVRLDFDNSTVAFRKNCIGIGSPQKIAPANTLLCAFEVYYQDNAATIA